MVESPTYYHSLSPVLRSLKEFDMENFPLQQEVIYARSTPDSPDYLKQAKTVNTRPIYKSDPKSRLRDWQSGNDISKGEMDFQRFLEVFNIYSSTSLEASQCGALKQALMSRLAIIQGTVTIIVSMIVVSTFEDMKMCARMHQTSFPIGNK